jgi:hypothetical protein
MDKDGRHTNKEMQQSNNFHQLKPQSRICMPTWRGFKKVVFQGGLYEAQDILVEVDSVDLLHLEPARGMEFREKIQRKLIWKDISKRVASLNPGLKSIKLKKEYELFILVCQNWWDLLYVNAIEGWKEKCKTTVCWIDELYAINIPRYIYWMYLLRQFDHVILGMNGSINAVGKAIDRTCHFIPGAVDAIRFSPYPNPLPRVIDIYSIGRKMEGIHSALLELKKKMQWLYIFDTINVADCRVIDFRDHRDMLANIAKRSRYFIVSPAKMDDFSETGGQIEMGHRYFEGCAAGAILIGQIPDCESFRNLFDWPNAVIDLQKNGSDVAEVLSTLSSDPDRLREISRRNAQEALLRHDWAYRWKEILDIAGLKPIAAMDARVRRMRQLAEIAESDILR